MTYLLLRLLNLHPLPLHLLLPIRALLVQFPMHRPQLLHLLLGHLRLLPAGLPDRLGPIRPPLQLPLQQ